MKKRIVKLTVTIALAVALSTITQEYIMGMLTVPLLLALLYFTIANKLINLYERSQKGKDQGTKDDNQNKAGCTCGASKVCECGTGTSTS